MRSNLELNENGPLGPLVFPALTRCGGIDLRTAGTCPSISFPVLTLSTDYVTISTSNAVSVSFPVLTSATSFSLQDLPLMTTLDVSALQEVTVGGCSFGNFTVFNGVVDLPVLRTVQGQLTLSCPSNQVTGLNVPVLQSCGGFFLKSTGITAFAFPATLKTIDGSVLVECALPSGDVTNILGFLVALDGTGGTTLFQNQIVNLYGAPLSPAGDAYRLTLQGRGCTVTVS